MSGRTRGLQVLAAGAGATVQDLGRPGYAALGVPRSGALDPGALRLANRLVGNEEAAPGLEVVLGGLVLGAEGDVVLALTGAPAALVVEHGGRRTTHGTGAAVRVPDGARIEVVAPAVGLRSWLAVRGGLAVPQVLGSASTDLLSEIGAPLAEGDRLPLGPTPDGPIPPLDVAPLAAPSGETIVLRAVPGPRDDWFTEAALASLTEPWTVDPRSNRVGVRLSGAPLERLPARRGAELPSEGTVSGSVQIAANGLPVVFLADHPITGGYPVAATVVTADLPLAAQAVPGQQLRLRFVRGPRLS